MMYLLKVGLNKDNIKYFTSVHIHSGSIFKITQ